MPPPRKSEVKLNLPSDELDQILGILLQAPMLLSTSGDSAAEHLCSTMYRHALVSRSTFGRQPPSMAVIFNGTPVIAVNFRFEGDLPEGPTILIWGEKTDPECNPWLSQVVTIVRHEGRVWTRIYPIYPPGRVGHC